MVCWLPMVYSAIWSSKQVHWTFGAARNPRCGLQPAEPAVEFDVEHGHQAHVNEAHDKKHEEWNCRIVLVADRVIDDEHEVQSQHDFDEGHHAGPPQVVLGSPEVRPAFDAVLRRSLETGLDSEKRFNHRLGVADGKADSYCHQEW